MKSLNPTIIVAVIIGAVAAITVAWISPTTFNGILAIIIAAGAALTAAWISRSIKISEFRQKWIDDLRNDISAYVGAAEKWFRKYEEINPLLSREKEQRERAELFPIANDARVILQRIKLRFNPEDNPDKAQDDAFLQSLDDLINPGKVAPGNTWASWQALADDAVEKARKILRREWKVTKKVQIPCPSDFQLLCRKS
ncbi:MAG: hypothetical protein ACLPSW_00485 [Roseiarcus sp.]